MDASMSQKSPQQIVDDLASKAQLDSDSKETIQRNVQKYIDEGKKFNGELYTQDLKTRCEKSPGRVAAKKRKKIAIAIIITAIVAAVIVASAAVWRFAWDTSPLYGKQHAPATSTQQYEGGDSFGKGI
jgi:hypothetical protein